MMSNGTARDRPPRICRLSVLRSHIYSSVFHTATTEGPACVLWVPIHSPPKLAPLQAEHGQCFNVRRYYTAIMLWTTTTTIPIGLIYVRSVREATNECYIDQYSLFSQKSTLGRSKINHALPLSAYAHPFLLLYERQCDNCYGHGLILIYWRLWQEV